MRLCLMSLCTWIVMKLLRARTDRRVTLSFWAGNVLSTVPFGLMHADLVSMFGEPSTLLTLRTVLIVSGPGLAFGYLYWKRGLESAIPSHFAIDIIVHVLRPALERLV